MERLRGGCGVEAARERPVRWMDMDGGVVRAGCLAFFVGGEGGVGVCFCIGVGGFIVVVGIGFLELGEDVRVERFHATKDLGEDLHHCSEGRLREWVSRETGAFVEREEFGGEVGGVDEGESGEVGHVVS
jgi:hypothetical protein